MSLLLTAFPHVLYPRPSQPEPPLLFVDSDILDTLETERAGSLG
jgi:hypothetical protein